MNQPRRRALGLAFFLITSAWAQSESHWLDPDRTEPPGLKYHTFHSETAGADSSFLVYLPPGYESSQERYPVLYWLHGLGGTQRTGQFAVRGLDEAIRSGQAPPMIVVLVNGLRDSMYMDAKDGSRPVASVIVKDLVPHVDRAFRTIAEREARAIEGYSMGGHGAAVLGFGHPEVFGLVSIMAGALHTEDTIAERRAEIFAKVSGGDKRHYRAGSPWTIVEKNAARIRGRTRVRIGCGDQDRLLDWNRSYHELLGRLGIESEFIVADGVGHNGRQYYDRLGERAWSFYREAFSLAASR